MAKKEARKLVWGPAIEALDKLFPKDDVNQILDLGAQLSKARGNHLSWIVARAGGVKVRETDLIHAQNLVDRTQVAFEEAYARLVERYPGKETKLLELLAQVGLVGQGDADGGDKTGLIPELAEERLASLIGYDEGENDGLEAA